MAMLALVMCLALTLAFLRHKAAEKKRRTFFGGYYIGLLAIAGFFFLATRQRYFRGSWNWDSWPQFFNEWVAASVVVLLCGWAFVGVGTSLHAVFFGEGYDKLTPEEYFVLFCAAVIAGSLVITFLTI